MLTSDESVLAYVARNPGCTARDVARDALGGTGATRTTERASRPSASSTTSKPNGRGAVPDRYPLVYADPAMAYRDKASAGDQEVDAVNSGYGRDRR